jgi:hypothetical protein
MKKRNLILLVIGLILIALILFFLKPRTTDPEARKPLNLEAPQDTLKKITFDTVGKQVNFRTDWYRYITVTSLGYQPYNPEGIKGWTATLTNESIFKLDYAKIEVIYVLPNKKVYTTKPIIITDIEPRKYKTVPIPDTEKAITVRYRFLEMKSSSYDFCYDVEYDALINKGGKFASPGGMSGNPKDPWKCK